MSSRISYLDSLPKKRMGAGCLFFDEQDRVLLVKPTYKPDWEIPGGIVELNESPKACCRREVREELGIEREIGSLLVLDYNSPTDDRTESLMFIFHGGRLTRSEIGSIQLRRDELSEFRFFTPETLPEEMLNMLRNRVLMAWGQAKKENGIYLENQEQK
jgi:ADP-ribose pyrophosphatase YjhB (NUDIX family)